eukprot:scaffold306214_cov20-Tisochrysis_lutea.AAC.1
MAALPRRPLFAVWATFLADASSTAANSVSSIGGGSTDSGNVSRQHVEGCNQRQEGQQQQQQQRRQCLLPFDAACVRGSAGIGWIAVDSTKP